MSEHNVHRQHRERVKSRFLAEGMDHMPPHNALELLLFYAIPQGDVNGLAHRLIERFGSYSAVIDAPYEQLLEVDGIGPHAATLLKLLPASARYYAADKCRDITLDTTEKALHYFIDLYLGIGDEQVYLTCLDGKSKVISSALLHPRQHQFCSHQYAQAGADSAQQRGCGCYHCPQPPRRGCPCRHRKT